MWKPTTIRLFGQLACKHTATGELSIASKYGEIYAYNDSVIGIIVYSPYIANKVRKMLNKGKFQHNNKYDEDLLFAPADMIKDISKVLSVKRNRKSMAKYLNSLDKHA